MNSESIETIKLILNKCNVHFNDFNQLDGLLIPRDILLMEETYTNVKKDIQSLKTIFSSSYMTSLQNSATKTQRWPLLNLVRQTLKNISYKMKPIRKSDGYTKEGTKKYKRFFQVEKIKKINKDKSICNDVSNNEYQEIFSHEI